MRQRLFLITMIFTLVLFLITGVLVSCSRPRQTANETEIPADAQVTVIEHGSVLFEARESVPEVTATDTAQEMSIKDGHTILENICAQCHLVQTLLQIKKSRPEWEGVLQQMEMMGVHLSEIDKSVLLNYLVATEEP
jgi:hypothetical protein